ncbi:MAG TPA: hypothetical protein VH114_05905 [Candidatus Acidoferrum sp.]|nr:hypothetical protein [Candidatus Acidoferrum sp.]
MKRQNGIRRRFLISLLIGLWASASSGRAQQQVPQQPASTSSDPSATGTKNEQDKKESAKPDATNATSKDRLFYALPNFLTLENAGQVPPLSAGEKFKVVGRSSFDYVQYPWYGFLAGISQAENSEPGYGQGAAGYGKRFGAAMADGTIENFMTSAVLPSLLRQDPRFFQSGKGSFGHRTWYAFSRIIITRSDSGNSQVNYSEIFGSALSAGISTYSYHPHADKTLANTGKVWGTQVGYDALTYVVKEFWPDIRHKLRKKK